MHLCPYVKPMKLYILMELPVSRLQEDLVNSKMRPGQVGLVHLDGQFKEFGLQVLTGLISMQLIEIMMEQLL